MASPRLFREAISDFPSDGCLPTRYAKPHISARLEVARVGSLRLRVTGLMIWHMKTLEEMIRDLSPDAQRQVTDLVRRLAVSSKAGPKRHLDQRWAGALKRYRDQYTSLELQKKALEWRGD